MPSPLGQKPYLGQFKFPDSCAAFPDSCASWTKLSTGFVMTLAQSTSSQTRRCGRWIRSEMPEMINFWPSVLMRSPQSMLQSTQPPWWCLAWLPLTGRGCHHSGLKWDSRSPLRSTRMCLKILSSLGLTRTTPVETTFGSRTQLPATDYRQFKSGAQRTLPCSGIGKWGPHHPWTCHPSTTLSGAKLRERPVLHHTKGFPQGCCRGGVGQHVRGLPHQGLQGIPAKARGHAGGQGRPSWKIISTWSQYQICENKNLYSLCFLRFRPKLSWGWVGWVLLLYTVQSQIPPSQSHWLWSTQKGAPRLTRC